MSRHGSPGHPATTPSFTIYVTVNFAATNYMTPTTALEGRRATIDAMLGLVRLCETNGWDLREAGVGGRDMWHKTMYVIDGDLIDASKIVPAVAAAVGRTAVMKASAGYPATAEQQEQLEEFCKDYSILPLRHR